ncbi:MAG: hypothetical protein R3301_13160 [Saprospiraceae bacterium]|nr:hypothetical protein [Saprospiraceae bacterium]
MKTIRFLIPFLILAGCVGDPQDIPPGITEDPVFVSSAILDGTSVAMQAGVDGYVLEAEHTTTDDGVVRYRTRFIQPSCTTCGPAIEFIFWDSAVSGQPGGGVDATFDSGDMAYYDAEMDSQLELLIAANEAAPGGVATVWTNSSGQVLAEGSSISLTSQKDTVVDICYHAAHAFAGATAQCVTSMCFHLRPATPCIAWLSVERMVNDHALVETNVIGTPPFTYRWMNGSTTPFILMPISSNHPTGVSVVVEDANGCSAVIHQTMQLVDGRPELCAGVLAGFSVDTADPPFAQFSTVEVRYTDSSGKIFSSAWGPQQESHAFELQEVSDYGISPDGFPVKLLRGQMHATLFAEDGGEPIRMQSGGFTIGVTYDE